MHTFMYQSIHISIHSDCWKSITHLILYDNSQLRIICNWFHLWSTQIGICLTHITYISNCQILCKFIIHDSFSWEKFFLVSLFKFLFTCQYMVWGTLLRNQLEIYKTWVWLLRLLWPVPNRCGWHQWPMHAAISLVSWGHCAAWPQSTFAANQQITLVSSYIWAQLSFCLFSSDRHIYNKIITFEIVTADFVLRNIEL